MRKRTRVVNSAMIGLLAATTTLGACASGSGKKSTRKPVTRDTAPTADSGIVTPGDPPTNSSKVAVMSAGERAALRERALTLLVNTAQAGSPEERANALEALIATPARLSAVAEIGLQDSSLPVRTIAAMAIGKAKLTSLAPRVRPMLQDNEPFPRAAAMYALKRCGASVDISPLAGMLYDPSPRVRANAGFILGELGDKSALGPLREAHRQSSAMANPAEMRISDLQLAEARVKLGDPTALADIRTALFPSKPEDLESAVLAIQIVGQVRDTVSVNRLIELTAPKDPAGMDMPGEVRMASAIALARLGQPQGSYIAREYFQGAKESLRAQSAILLGETQRPENLQLVSRLMEDPDGRVRVAAAAAVVKITDRGS